MSMLLWHSIPNSPYPFIIFKGAELASATVPWHWLFFCLALKVCYKNLPRNFPISFEASKWHWLILASIGALVYRSGIHPILNFGFRFGFLTHIEINIQEKFQEKYFLPCKQTKYLILQNINGNLNNRFLSYYPKT